MVVAVLVVVVFEVAVVDVMSMWYLIISCMGIIFYTYITHQSRGFWARLTAYKAMSRALSPIKPAAGPGLGPSPGFRAKVQKFF